ncbi:MAG: PAS domain-containing sensor histidine kinase [Gammaproteobacteria bacterium]|nr:PAS domain-containing sensor histidine kinase [Gammaproteobacteria bacterium]MDH3407014.1 PAS domain-containing sensor histidine kinase [Gammaproteobacteria bacterium]MDH3563444.1 PAS domain-containing sensor histidine kinase [Gammaproteobacteria bacterium]
MDSVLPRAGQSRAEGQAAIATQNWKLLEYFNFYRLALALAAASIAITVGKFSPFGEAHPGLFLSTSIVFALISVTAVFSIHWRTPDYDSQAALLAFADVTLLTIIMHASGGISSGLGLMLVVAIAGTSLMLGKQLTIFYASLATIAVGIEYWWGWLTGGKAADTEMLQDFPQVGLFGVGLFATAFFGYLLANRLRATEELAQSRGVDVVNLTQLNELVIQRMQSGVVICDPQGNIRMMNQAAQKYLGLHNDADKNSPLNEISPDLAIQLFQWLGNTALNRGRKVFTSRVGYSLLPRFVTLGNDKNSVKLIFLEDMSILKQQAQQLKMAALARLTASIAHEIRNPLGALSNAAQLLGETMDSENAEEKRLVKIIDEQGKRMNVIVQNVTQLSRRDRINPVKLELQPWLEDFLRQHGDTVTVPRDAFIAHGLEGLSVCVDPDQLYQVVSNLCQNALRHSPPFTGTPLIKFQGTRDNEDRPILDVIDWGSGVNPDIADNIFDPFFTTTPKGTGLGLYIARELCEGNGATLNYYPGEGGVGSRFRITFVRAEDCADLGTL